MSKRMTTRPLSVLSLLFVLYSLIAPAAHAQIPTRIIANPSFEEPDLSNCPNGAGSGIGYGQPPQDDVPSWFTSHSSITPPSGGQCPLNHTYPAPIIELWEDGFNGVPAQDAAQFAELNAEEQSRLYQEICLQAGETVSYSYFHRARQVDGETSRAGLYSSVGVLLDNGPNDVAVTSAWTNHSGTLTNPGAAGIFQYGFEALTAGTLGNFIDNVSIDLPPVLELVDITPVSGDENTVGSLSLRFYVSGTLDNAATFTLTLTGASTATAGTDFTVATGALSRGNVDSFISGTITVTIPGGNYYDPNETGGIGQGLISIPLAITPDTFTEGDETIVYQLGAVVTGGGSTAARDLTFADASCDGLTLSTVTGTIVDDDEADHGDAPASYGDPAHDILSPTTIYLGVTPPDSEAALQADDGADEDGVTLPALAQNTFASISATVAGAGGFLQAWIDFDGDGSFDAGEQIATDLQDGGGLDTDATTGVIAFQVLVPATAVTTPTYARFRWSTNAGLDAVSAATDGEVEDYPVTIQSTNPPFVCDNSIYQLAGTLTRLRQVTFNASGASFNDLGIASQPTNAGWGFNEIDNYIYGIRTGTTDLYRVDASGGFTNLGSVAGINNGSVAGDVDPNGILITRTNTGTYYRIDLTDPAYPVVGSFTISGDAAGQNFIDIAYNPDDGLLYAVRGGRVYSIDPVTGVSVEIMNTSVGLTTASGAWFDEDGILYAYDNGTNTYYAMDLATQQTAIIGVSDIDEEGRNDGTSCRGPRPVPLGKVTGTIYEDVNRNDTYDAGTDTPIPDITVSVYEENGTPGDFGDDTLITSVVSDANGFYAVSLILAFAGNTYRVETDLADPDLPAERTPGTPHPLTNVPVTDGSTIADQDFGFDIGVLVSGTIYEDTQPNGTLDSNETGTGETLYAKLLPRTGSTCNAPATQAVAADPATGAYTLINVLSGDYCVIVDTNNTLSDTTPSPPTAWLITSPTNGVRHISTSTQNVPNQHFGLFAGSLLTGAVFQDTGNPSGAANDGIQNGTETGIANVTLSLTDCASTVHDTVTTNASGAYTLHIPGTVPDATPLCVIETNPASYLSTGASVGDTSGSYDRASDTIQFTYSLATDYSGVNFGDVPPNQWLTDGQQSGLPGSVVWHPHTFIAGSAGTVTFSTAASPSPAVSGWSETLYEDSNCNGAIDSGEGQISSKALSAGQQVCVLLREAIPHAASDGASQHVTVTASFDYSNATPILSDVQTRTDVTTVGEGEAAGLHLHKAVDKAQALPGEVITYTITYSNRSAEPLSNIVIHDRTPAFTVFQSAVCDTPLPASLSGCNVTQQPAPNGAGSIEWTLVGNLGSGHQGTVTFSIQIQN